jgi:hypothetical protein
MNNPLSEREDRIIFGGNVCGDPETAAGTAGASNAAAPVTRWRRDTLDMASILLVYA